MLDTAPAAARAQVEAYQRLGPERRFMLACGMSDSIREVARARIRKQHPDLTEAAVQDELVWELYGVRQQR